MASINLSRKELYGRVWAVPMAQLATELGVSDVTINKTCRRLKIPKPPRGYWARLESGRRGKKTPLPKLPKSEERKAALAEDPSPEKGEAEIISEIKVLNRVMLPKNLKQLHPMAIKLRDELYAVQPDRDEHRLVKIKERPDLPTISVTESMITPVLRAFHVIVTELESRGIEYKPHRGKYGSPEFHCGQYTLSLSIEEPIVTVKRDPTDLEKRVPSWEWNLSAVKPAGRLIFNLNTGSYYNRTKKPIEQKADIPLEECTAQVIEAIWKTFMDRRYERLESARKWEKEEAEQEKRRAAERISEHSNTLKKINAKRMENLLWAAQWWNIANITENFIQACEEHWRGKPGDLSAEEHAWLVWAKKIVPTLPTANFEYPNPVTDGPINLEEIPIGGPYPNVRKIPRPPTMPEPAPPAKPQYTYSTQTQPYPFWLKHQR